MRNRLTQDQPTLFVDQYGQKIVARSAKELRAKRGGGHVAKLYYEFAKDAHKGDVWCGYVVGSSWFTAYKRVEVAA